MIKWILFDQAGVQIKMFPTKETYIINNKSYSGDLLAKIYTHRLYTEYKIGKISEKNFVKVFLEESNIDLSIDSYIDFFNNEVELIPGILNLILELKHRYKLASVINEGKEWSRSKFKKTSTEEVFDSIFISGEIGLKKPDKEMFEYVLNKINAKPEECIFIDDLKVNCQEAEKLGIKSIYFKDTEQIRKELTEIKII